jgi:1-acyl-sn-glycerol-3-phosphate acyltransferase
MIRDPRFDDIRPYYDEEIPAAMQRIADSGVFPLIASYIFPDRRVEDVRDMVRSLKTCDEFQVKVMWHVNDQIMKRTMTSFTYSGIENLEKDRHYLFISNHRDIMLDASLMQNVLFDNGMATSEITFGANLMSSSLVIDIGKSNKMFRVERPGIMNLREFYEKSKHLSEYIRFTITQKGNSIWIAQRNGRTKDGNDTTDQGVIKMLTMSKRNDKIAALDELNIVPLSISYEWETCDYMKALELYQSRYEKYVKKQGEDMASIINGISKPKGDVHLSICKPISRDDLLAFDSLTNIEYEREVAKIIDHRIHEAYRLTPNNFIAHDLRFGKHEFKGDKYNDEQEDRFIRRANGLLKYEVEEPEVLKDIFLGIYSNPVDNCYRR